MNTITAYALFLAAFFVMIVLALLRVLPVDYFGEIVIALFIAGLFYSWLNAWRQTKKIIQTESVPKKESLVRSSEERRSELEEQHKKTEEREPEQLVAA